MALCQSGGPLIRLKRKAQKVVPDQAARATRCAARLRAPRLYGLMTFDETGGALHLSGVILALRLQAERDPLHPIRVIPAREVSGSSQSSIPRRAAYFIGVRMLPWPALPAGFVPGTRFLSAVRKGLDDRLLFSYVFCSLSRRS